MSNTYQGSCFCGAVQLEVSGDPAAMGYCHCRDCAHWSAGPINTFTLWPPENVKVTQGADQIDTYNKTENSYRKWCKQCGGHLFSEHPGMGLTDVYAPVIPDLPFKPMMHVFYGEKMVSVKDGLPKLKDVPAEMGGSGETLPE
ncbi:MAG: GFA family protein [Gammaproteobacteria bacterium]